MKKNLITIALALFLIGNGAFSAFAQNKPDPAVNGATVTPSPQTFPALNPLNPGVAGFYFQISNDGPVGTSSSSVKVTISMTGMDVNTNFNILTDIVATGSAQSFTWSYYAPAHTFTGTLNGPFPAFSGGIVTVSNLVVTMASPLPLITNGINVNINAPQTVNADNSPASDNTQSFTFTESPVATPVTLSTFSGALDNNVSNLTWTVWGEYDIANYEVLRSTNAIDFVSVGKVTANNSKTYKLADNVAGLGNKFYYKLKINERSKEFNYSKVIELRKSADNKITIYPNPTSHVVNISSLIGTETISVLSVDGRKIMEQKASGGNNVVDIKKLANGTYSLVITNGSEVTTFKIVKN